MSDYEELQKYLEVSDWPRKWQEKCSADKEWRTWEKPSPTSEIK